MQTSSQLPRRHDIDSLRVLAFGLLILYHAGMFYVSWGWHVKSAYQADWLEPVMLLLNQWRMPLIFLISGLAVSLMLGEKGKPRMGYGAFARSRTQRLMLPLLFGMAVIVPPQVYFEVLGKGVIESGYPEFLWRYYSFGGWPEDAFGGAHIGITWNHLWYLPYLLVYTLTLIPLAALMAGRGKRIRERFQSLRGIWLVIVPLLPLMAWGYWVYPRFPYIRHDLVTDGYAHAMYGTFFLYGYLIGRDPGLWSELKRLRWWTLCMAFLGYGLFMAGREILDDQTDSTTDIAFLFVLYLNRWVWILTALGWAHHLLNRPFRWLPYARAAVYPWYILHQTITVSAGYHLSRLELVPATEGALLLIITVGGCALIHHYLVLRIRWLGPLMGYTPKVTIKNLPPVCLQESA
jgi:glucan biosynthesis protein C